MSKAGNLFTTLRLNLDNADDMEAWNNLMSADSSQPEYRSYTRTIVTAVNDHFARMDQPDHDELVAALLEKVQETVQETIVSAMNDVIVTTMPPMPPVSEPASKQTKPLASAGPSDEAEIEILSFLDNF